MTLAIQFSKCIAIRLPPWLYHACFRTLQKTWPLQNNAADLYLELILYLRYTCLTVTSTLTAQSEGIYECFLCADYRKLVFLTVATVGK